MGQLVQFLEKPLQEIRLAVRHRFDQRHEYLVPVRLGTLGKQVDGLLETVGFHIPDREEVVFDEDETDLRNMRLLALGADEQRRGEESGFVLTIETARAFDFAHLLARRQRDPEMLSVAATSAWVALSKSIQTTSGESVAESSSAETAVPEEGDG